MRMKVDKMTRLLCLTTSEVNKRKHVVFDIVVGLCKLALIEQRATIIV